MPSDVPLARFAAPHGLAFAVEDLARVQDWADARRLSMAIALDHVMEGAEFEEVLVLTSADRRRRVLTLWRTRSGIYSRTPWGRPRRFATVGEALEAEHAARSHGGGRASPASSTPQAPSGLRPRRA